jgi:hypothetical protein
MCRPGEGARVAVARAGNRDRGDEETLARKAAGDSMGKYKQWLHHQEIGRRLRDQISTLEQERARVQKMAPAHPTALPELDNPIISALLSFTRAGNKLSNIDPIKAAMPPMDPNLDRSRPATSTATTASTGAGKAASAGDQAVVASLLARAEQMPSDPLDQMRELARAQDGAQAAAAPAGSGSGPTPPGAGPLPPVDSVGGWWQRQKTDDHD